MKQNGMYWLFFLPMIKSSIRKRYGRGLADRAVKKRTAWIPQTGRECAGAWQIEEKIMKEKDNKRLLEQVGEDGMILRCQGMAEPMHRL